MLHPCVRSNDEEAAEPRPQANQKRGEPMRSRSQSLFAKEEYAQKARFQKEREDSFHRVRLPNDTAGRLRKSRPVGAELKLHGNAGHHTHGEVDGEDLCPKTGSAVVMLIACPQSHRLEDQDQEREPHRQLRKNIMKRHRESEVQAVNSKSVHGERQMSPPC